MKSSHYAEITLPLPVDQAFTYSVPDSLVDRVQVGMRAVIPVKRRIETGYIVALKAETELDPKIVKPIIDLPDEAPVFSPSMIKLCRWIADYYCCSWGEALQTAVPAGMRIGTKMQYQLAPHGLNPGNYTERQKKIIAALHMRGVLTERQLAKAAGATALSNTLQSLVRRGIVLAEPVAAKAGVNIRTETWACLLEAAVPDNEGLAAMQRRAPKQAAIYFDLLHGDPERAASALYDKHHVTRATLKALEEKGLIQLEEREFYRAPEFSAKGQAADKFKLNAEQREAYGAIIAPLEEGRFQACLLRGITGSGKTEVYLQAIERALALGRDAIILVPEISLTPQTVGRFFARFKESIAVLHSGLSTGERYDEWRRAQRGEVRIVVGARSAIFAPLKNVGVIVVDEEHDHSYKQSDTPRYHGRDVAIMRAKMDNAVCVLGSATPSVESAYNATIGKSIRLDLLQRATKGSLPEVKLIDMRKERGQGGGQILLSKTLEDAVNARVKAKEQVILLLNRRGFSPFVICPQCGWCAECGDCQVSLTYHSHGGVLRCHYCNREEPKPEVCPKCFFNPLLYLGMGTQKAEDYLMRAFEGARVERMDADSTSGKGGHAKILGRFAAGEIDILIGTQMLAKGHDYPGVTLVGVINADTGLSLPDFRAAEQTFQLMTQVAGRAGRGDKIGEVFIQTFRPKHYAVQAAAQHDYEGFYEREIAYRQDAGYPPYRRLANFALESEDPQLAARHAAMLRRITHDLIKSQGLRQLELLGPSPAAIRRVKKKYRWHFGILALHPRTLNQLVRQIRDKFHEEKTGSKVQLKVDLDPYGMY